MFAAIVLGFSEVEQVEVDHASARQHHGDGHGLAQRASQAQHGRGDDAARRTGAPRCLIISHRVAPNASAASSCSAGSAGRPRGYNDVMIGRIITANTTPRCSMVRPVPDAGPAENRDPCPGESFSHCSIGTQHAAPRC